MKEKEEDIFNFRDFLNKPNNVSEKVKSTSTSSEEKKVYEVVEEVEVEETEEVEVFERTLVPEEENDYYKIYKDRSEEFSCEMLIEGSDQSEATSRLIIESEYWTLMFDGEIKNGMCTIPIRKLNILEEGQIGKIRLEVIAEGNIFIPWEDTFEVKLSKKVTVKITEKKSQKPQKKEKSIKVNVLKRNS